MLPPSFQRKALETRQYVARSRFKQAAPERATREAMRVKQSEARAAMETPGSWRCQEYVSSAEESHSQQVESA
jgi:hypothetical protein